MTVTALAPAWADPTQITDPADKAAHMRRSPIVVTRVGAGELRTVIVDDGNGPRLHLEARTEDGLDVEQAAALVEALAAQVEVLRAAR
ncbi:hypothetical protein [Georgenia daeguensis]|uniref:Uncharacterized protein n=1 Tax=Georgenia daeguensis TaxID=908355 RepID=A0ABP8EXW4_9MICO